MKKQRTWTTKVETSRGTLYVRWRQVRLNDDPPYRSEAQICHVRDEHGHKVSMDRIVKDDELVEAIDQSIDEILTRC